MLARTVSQLPLKIGSEVNVAGAARLVEEDARIGDPIGVHAEAAQPHRAKLVIANGDRRRGAPLLVNLQPRREEIDL